MGFANNGIATDAAQFFCNLAGCIAFFPELFQLVNSFVSPCHLYQTS
jgi:hypothetical protein